MNLYRALGLDAHSTLLKVVKENLEVEAISGAAKPAMTINYSRSVYMSGMKTPNEQLVTPSNEVEVPEKKDGYMQRVFANDNFYGTGKQKFETVMLQAETMYKNRIKYDKILSAKC